MLTLTLDGQPVDLPADAAVALSYRSSDLRRLDTREAAFSETFALPLTARNARVLGTPHALSSQTRSPYRRLPAVLRSNGLPVLSGVAVLEASELGYEVTLFDDTADLFGRVGDQGLQALDLSALDHARALPDIQAASTDDPARGYVYALADTGRLGAAGADDRVTATEVPASVYESYLLRAIVARALPGFALTGTLLTDPLFARAVLPSVYSVPRLRESYLAPRRVQAGTDADRLYELPAGGSTREAADLLFPVLVLGDPAYFQGDTRYQLPVHTAEVTISGRLLVKNDGFKKYLALHGANQALPLAHIWRQEIPGRVPSERNTAFLINFTATVPAITLASVGALSLRVTDADNGSAVPGTDPTIRLTLLAGSSVTFAVSAPALAGAPVHLETGLPDISQGDYLKLVANRFNASFAVDAAARTVRFDLLNELERNRGRAVDWSRQLDYAPRPRLEYRIGSYAQANTLRYDDAPAAYAPVFGRLSPAAAAAQVGTGLLAVPDLTLPATAEAYAAPLVLPLVRPVCGGAAEVAYLPTATPADPADPRGAVAWTFAASYRKGDRVTSSGRTWTCLADPFGVKAQPGDLTYSLDWSADPVPTEQVLATAVLLALPATAPLLYDEHNTAAAPASFRPVWGLGNAGLSFAELLPAYHEGTARILARVQLLTAYFTLHAADIAQLDFSRPIALNIPWVAGYGALRGSFYLNLVDQYRPGVPGPVRVELVRLGDPVAGLAPDATPLPARPERLLLTEAGPPLLTETPVYLAQERA